MTDPRTELYERAASMADAGTLTESEARQLLAHHRARVDGIFREATRSAHPRRGEHKGAGAAIGSWILGAAAIGLLSRLSTVEWIILATATAMVIGFRLWLGYLSGRYRVRREGAQLEFASASTHIAECLRRRACPECDYGLSGIHPNIDLMPERGVELGPRACPECGAKWPLVPKEFGR